MAIFTIAVVGGALVIGGLLATGYLASQVGQVLFQEGRLQNFRDVDEVQDALLAANRPDLAQELMIAVAQGDTQSFGQGSQPPYTTAQPLDALSSIGGFLNEAKDLLPLALVGFIVYKGLKK